MVKIKTIQQLKTTVEDDQSLEMKQEYNFRHFQAEVISSAFFVSLELPNFLDIPVF